MREKISKFKYKGKTFNLGMLRFCLFLFFIITTLFGAGPFISVMMSKADTADIDLKVSEVISIAIDADDVSFNLIPNKAGTFGSSQTTVRVFTNSDGYKLYMNNKTADNALQHESVADKISALTIPNATSSSFGLNEWGYSLDGTTYNAVPTSTILIATEQNTALQAVQNGKKPSDSAASNNAGTPSSVASTTVHFGANVNTDIASGKYTDTVVFTVTGNNVPPVAPEIIPSTSGWKQSVTLAATESGSTHDIDHFEYNVVKSTLALTASDSNIKQDAATKTPTQADPATGQGLSVTISKSSGYADGIYYVYFRSVDVKNNKSNWSTANIAKIDNTAPQAPVITVNSYDRFSFASSDATNSALTYFVSAANNTTRPTNASNWLGEPERIITSAGTYYAYVRDEAGNISDPTPITAYRVIKEADVNSTSTAKYDSTTGTAWADNNAFALNGTKLYVSGAANSNYTISKIYCGSTNGATSPQNCTVNGETKFHAEATDQTKPSTPTITRSDYNTFTYTATDGVGVTGYYVSTSSTAPTTSSTWVTTTSKDIGNAAAETWYVWARDAAGNISDSASIKSFKVTRSATNASLTTKYENASGTAFTSTTYVLNGTPIYVEASANSGYTLTALTFAGATISTKSTNNVTKETAIVATAVDQTKPSTPTITRSDYNTFTYTATDGVGVTGYYVSKDNATAPTTSNTWVTTTSYDIAGAGTYYVWAKDAAGNISDSASIVAYSVTQGTNSNALSSAKYVSTSGTAWSSSANYALAGTPLYAYGTANSGYTLTKVYCGSTNGATSPQNCTVNAATTFYAQATDQTKPGTPTITRSDYNTFTYTATDGVGVTGYYVSKDNATAPTTSSTWVTTTSYDITGAGTYRVWARDAAGNISAAASIVAYTVSRSVSNATLTTRYDSTSSSTGTVFTSTIYVLNGTSIYGYATANSDYVLRTMSPMSNGSYSTVAGADMTVTASATLKNITDLTYMQDMTSTICANSSVDQSKTVKDAGDIANSYTIKKLADSRCWMTTNYNIGSNSSTTPISTTYYNITSAYTIPQGVSPFPLVTSTVLLK